MTTTPAPTDLDALKAKYGPFNDRGGYIWRHMREVDADVTALLDELAKTRRELDEQRATLDRVAKFADDMTTWCSPHGVSAHYAERLREVLANPATTAEPAASTDSCCDDHGDWCQRTIARTNEAACCDDCPDEDRGGTPGNLPCPRKDCAYVAHIQYEMDVHVARHAIPATTAEPADEPKAAAPQYVVPTCPACGEEFTPEQPGSNERCPGCRYYNRPRRTQVEPAAS